MGDDALRTGGRSSLLLAFVLGFAVVGDRAVIAVATGGRGMFPLIAIGAPLVAAFAIGGLGSRRTMAMLRQPEFVLGVSPYLLLTAILPILGVMVNRYEDRTLLSVTEATTALSFLVIGAAIAADGSRAWTRWLLLAVFVQFVYASGQALYFSRAPGWQLFSSFHAWDLSLQSLDTLVQSRSSGLYLNPNELGLWAAIAIVLSWTMLRPTLRTIGVVLGGLTLVLSQSRGATVALVVAAAVGFMATIASGKGVSRVLSAVATFLVAAVLVGVLASIVQPSAAIGDRFAGLVRVLTQGPQADVNLAGRVAYWAAVLDLNAAYPFGTWGSPEALLGSAVDSSWVRAFAQGSVAYVFTLAILLGTAFRVGEAYAGALRFVVVVIAVAAVTQTPFGYPIIAAFWALLGANLQVRAENVAEPVHARSARARPGATHPRQVPDDVSAVRRVSRSRSKPA